MCLSEVVELWVSGLANVLGEIAQLGDGNGRKNLGVMPAAADGVTRDLVPGVYYIPDSSNPVRLHQPRRARASNLEPNFISPEKQKLWKRKHLLCLPDIITTIMPL